MRIGPSPNSLTGLMIAGMLVMTVSGCANPGGRGGGTGGDPGHPANDGGTMTSDGSSGSGGVTGTGGAPSGEDAGVDSTGSGGRTGSGGGTASGGSTATGGRGAGGASAGQGAGGDSATGGASGSGGMTDAGMVLDAAADTADATDTASDSAADSAVLQDAATNDAAPPACSASQAALKAGDSTVTLQSGGRSRSYIRHVPSGLTAGTAVPVVIDLHGAGGNGKQQQGMSGFSALADKEKFLAIFPDGVDGYWNVDDTCCGTAGQQKVDDVGFLRAIITKVSAETCVDGSRVYVTGFSNGGGLAHRMGCDAADVVAAIAPTATDLRTQPCKAARPISMMEVKGLADSLEPYGGGLVGPDGGQYVAVGAKASQKLWADIDKCAGSTTQADKYCDDYTQCAAGVEVDLCSLPNTDHSTYGNNLGFDVANVVWSMFKRQPMK